MLQSCLTLCDPMDCSLAGSFVHGIIQARVLEWAALPLEDPPPGDISNPGIDPKSPAWQQIFYHWGMLAMGLPCWLRNKESACHTGDNVRDAGLIPESGRFPGGRHGNPLQYSCLENPMDREAWQATIHRVRKSQTQLKRLRTHTCWLMATTPSSVQLSTNY